MGSSCTYNGYQRQVIIRILSGIHAREVEHGQVVRGAIFLYDPSRCSASRNFDVLIFLSNLPDMMVSYPASLKISGKAATL
jgi:hypothetical protein